MILSSYERADSPFVWLQWSMKPSEKKRYIKTTIRKTDKDKERRVEIAKVEFQAKLLRGQSQSDEIDGKGTGWGWVIPFLNTKYSAHPSTLRTNIRQWKPLLAFLVAERINAPAFLERQHAFGYVAWRTAQVKEKSGKHPKLTTALGELKVLSKLMKEAVSRDYCPVNPVQKLGIEREESEMKPEITPEEQIKIEAALSGDLSWLQRRFFLTSDPGQWMGMAFRLAIRTGIRFAETSIARTRVRWDENQILIEKPKGGRSREFCIPIYDSIRPILLEWKPTGATHTWRISEKEMLLSGLIWGAFFKHIQLPHICFHCTRVTFISRGMRAGIPESVMMKMVNHASKLISRIYQRWTPDDVRRYAAQVPDPCSGSSRSENPKT